MMAVADRHLWFTRDRAHVVETGDVRARFLFAPTGTQISDADMERLGLSEKDGKIVLPVGTLVAVGGAPETDSRPAPGDAPDPSAIVVGVDPENPRHRELVANTVREYQERTSEPPAPRKRGRPRKNAE